MLIKALCEYSEFRAKKDDDALPDYLVKQDVHYLIHLTPDGEINGISDIRKNVSVKQSNGKEKTVQKPFSIIVPKRSQKPGIDLNIIEHRPLYIFGLNYENGAFTPDDKTNKARKSHECFIKGNLEFCKDITSPVVQAYCSFLEKWKPEDQLNNPHLISLGKDYSSSYYCFALDGHSELLLNKDKLLLEKYAEKFRKTADENVNVISDICAIEGENLPIARIHEKIRGIRGGNSVGSVLVGINDTAFESYGKSQSFNSNISEQAMMKYTSALNMLLSDKSHSMFLGDTTLIYFAMSQDDSNECFSFADAFDADPYIDTDKALVSVANEMNQGREGGRSALKTDENVMFYVVGFTPNSSRISQKFLIRNQFGKIMDNIAQHQKDMAIKDNDKQIKMRWILGELVSPNSTSDVVPSPLSSSLFYSVLNGTKYPDGLLSTVIRRVRTDSDIEKNHFIKINDTRIGIIKACLNRKARLSNNKEEIKMALDLENKDPAYLCGRLFAVLEIIQQNSANGTLNSTIKDKFFSSACVKPSTVFPRLIMLSQNHISKLESTVYWNKCISDIVGVLGSEFPQTLSLDDQGKFIIGYYHQNNAFYTKKNNNE